MTPIEEMQAILSGELSEDELMHYGMPRRSGRYPWGSGKEPYQHSGDFLARVQELQNQKNLVYIDEKTGKKYTGNTAVAKHLGLTTTEFRAQLSMAKDERRALEVETAKSMRAHGHSLNEIAKAMGYNNDSSVRALLNENTEARMNQAKLTAQFLKEQVDKKGMIDVGVGVEKELNVSAEKLKEALTMLEMQGYPTYGGGVPQVTNPGNQTNMKVLCPPGTEHKEIFQAFNNGEISSVRDYISHDGGDTFDKKFVYPASMDSKRLQIVYAEDGGTDRDGVIELRRGVPDLDLGGSHYSQVRILVDGTHYLKGMAVYSDDLPDGVDVRFNTNKTKDKPMEKVLKEIKNDPDNPFGSAIREGGQSYYIDPKTGERKLSLINKRADEGDWSDWKDKLPSQFLSKQNLTLVNKQLGLALADRTAEFDEIKALVNPTVKKQMLNSFADDCDSAAVHLYAAALPRQKYQVILPVPSMKDNEVFAPNFHDGEKVALIRYPHGGTFEIPILTVNNRQKDAKSLVGTNAKDVVCINGKVAERLSGADFDGDTVMVIPTNNKTKITATNELEGLKGFDPKFTYGTEERVKPDGTKAYYRGDKEIKVMKNTQTEMGKISNLITDMTLKGASTDDLAKAVRHSMVVIDAEKHKLDYKQSEIDNDIASLKNRYQGHYDAEGNWKTGAGTLISRAKGQYSVDKRQGQPKVNIKGTDWYDPTRPEGALIYKTSDKLTYDVTKTNKRTGEEYTVTKTRTQKSTQMAETDDARTLSSGHPTEEAYANYANSLKAMANEARVIAYHTKNIPYSASAKETYQNEVNHLLSQLNVSLMNAPRERQAQIIANAEVQAKKQANPDMKPGDVKKASQLALTKARQRVGAERHTITLTDREWEAIQAGAVSHTQLEKIIRYVDGDELRQRATPRSTTQISTAKQSRIKAMAASGYTNSEIAKMLNISSSTVSKYL